MARAEADTFALKNSAIAARKDLNMGYEHRWTPDTEKQAYSQSMQQQPTDLLARSYAGRHLAPAGVRQQRGVSSLDATYHSFGTGARFE